MKESVFCKLLWITPIREEENKKIKEKFKKLDDAKKKADDENVVHLFT